MNELKVCVCGGKVKCDTNMGMAFILCDKCGAVTSFRRDNGKSATIAAWNRRADRLPKILDAIRNRLHYLSFESSDWSHGEHPRVVELDEIDDLMDEFDELCDNFPEPPKGE